MSIKKLITLCLLIVSYFSIQAQSAEDFGYADPSIPELAQFAYYRGVWQSKLEIKQKNGSFKKIEGGAQITGRFLDDHKTFQSQFTTPDGFFSTDIRTYNVTTNQWEALFLNANAQRWHKFTSQLIDDKMTTFVIGGYSGEEDFDIKVVDTIIDSNQFLKEVFQSKDNGDSWVLTYKITVSKLKT